MKFTELCTRWFYSSQNDIAFSGKPRRRKAFVIQLNPPPPEVNGAKQEQKQKEAPELTSGTKQVAGKNGKWVCRYKGCGCAFVSHGRQSIARSR